MSAAEPRRIDRPGVYDLTAEAEAARLLLAEMQRAGYGDDDELLADTVEGGTSFLEAVEAALAEMDQRTALADAIEARIKAMRDRKERVLASVERIRDAIATAIEASGVKLPLRLPSGTVSLRESPPSVVVIDEAVIPERFFDVKTTRLLSKARLREALRAGDDVDGATLENIRQVLAVRR